MSNATPMYWDVCLLAGVLCCGMNGLHSTHFLLLTFSATILFWHACTHITRLLHCMTQYGYQFLWRETWLQLRSKVQMSSTPKISLRASTPMRQPKCGVTPRIHSPQRLCQRSMSSGQRGRCQSWGACWLDGAETMAQPSLLPSSPTNWKWAGIQRKAQRLVCNI